MSVAQSFNLQWDNFRGVPKNVPKSVLYQELTANSGTDQGYSFHIRSPAANALLNNEVWIEYSFTFGSNGLANLFNSTYIADAKSQKLNSHVFAMRQCWPVSRAISNLSVTINGVNISDQPYLWIDAMNRICISDEEAETICSISGGAFDTGMGWAWPSNVLPKVGVGAAPTQKIQIASLPGAGRVESGNDDGTAVGNGTATPMDVATEAHINLGMGKRYRSLANKIRDDLGRTAALAQTGKATYTMKVQERLPISPFLFHDNKDIPQSIPNIRTMHITAQFVSDLASAIMQNPREDTKGAGNDNANITFTFSEKPKIRLRWYLSETALPQEVSIKCPINRTFINTFTTDRLDSKDANLAKAVFPEESYTGINLEGIPDMIMIYARNAKARIDAPSEHFLSIDKLELTVGGASGKMNNISQGELYAQYLKHTRHRGLKKIDYETWKRYRCVALLKPDDIGLDRGPGFNYPVQLSIRATFASYYRAAELGVSAFLGGNAYLHPFTAVKGESAENGYNLGGSSETWQFCVVVVYEKFKLTIGSSGGAILEMLKA